MEPVRAFAIWVSTLFVACGGVTSLGSNESAPTGGAGGGGGSPNAIAGAAGFPDLPDPPSITGPTSITCNYDSSVVPQTPSSDSATNANTCRSNSPTCSDAGTSCSIVDLSCRVLESCCRTTWTPAGRFDMGRGEATEQCDDHVVGCNDDELPEHQVTLSPYFMSAFEVTTGRFEVFVDAGFGTAAMPPAVGSGAPPGHPEAGWQDAWSTHLPPTKDALATSISRAPGTAAPVFLYGDNAMNDVTFYEAFAFCVWDGGRLPTEAEWEFAAAAGPANRRFPWGNAAPTGATVDPAVEGATGLPYRPIPNQAVATSGLGASATGQWDLAGNVAEWTLDVYGAYPAIGCVNPLAVGVDGADRSVRGGSFRDDFGHMRATARDHHPPDARHPWLGFRCVRDGQ